MLHHPGWRRMDSYSCGVWLMFFGCLPCCGKCDPAFLPSTVSLDTSLAVAHPGVVFFGPLWLSNSTAPLFTQGEVLSTQRLLDFICHRHSISINATGSVLDAINAPSFSETLDFISAVTVDGRVNAVYSGESQEVTHSETMSGMFGSYFAEMIVSYSARTTATVTFEETESHNSPCWRIKFGVGSSLSCSTSATISVSHQIPGYSYSASINNQVINNFLGVQELHGLEGSNPSVFPLAFSGQVNINHNRPYILSGGTLSDPPRFSSSYNLTLNE